jgi:myo-inositol-1(or 4)-monophosphatase
MNLENLCTDVSALAKQVGEFIRTERKTFSAASIEHKGHNDLVSYVDKTAEQKIVDGLSRLLPESGFITEENTSTKKGKSFNWIIDPLDGTTNFIHGVPCFCISIALMRDHELIVGVVYEVNLDECFYAFENGGAFLNGNKISVSHTDKLKDSLLATGFPYSNYSRMKEYMKVFEFLMHNTHGLRRLGSAAVDLAYVACGRFEGFYEYGLNSWDVAAGAFIVKEAGGKVSDFSGGNDFVFGREIVASNSVVSDELLSIIKAKFSS